MKISILRDGRLVEQEISDDLLKDLDFLLTSVSKEWERARAIGENLEEAKANKSKEPTNLHWHNQVVHLSSHLEDSYETLIESSHFLLNSLNTELDSDIILVDTTPFISLPSDMYKSGLREIYAPSNTRKNLEMQALYIKPEVNSEHANVETEQFIDGIRLLAVRPSLDIGKKNENAIELLNMISARSKELAATRTVQNESASSLQTVGVGHPHLQASDTPNNDNRNPGVLTEPNASAFSWCRIL